MIEVPYQQLSEDALIGIIEAYVLRDGTDYGEREISHEEKLLQVRRLIVDGEVLIVYDEQSESCTLVSKVDFVPSSFNSARSGLGTE